MTEVLCGHISSMYEGCLVTTLDSNLAELNEEENFQSIQLKKVDQGSVD